MSGYHMELDTNNHSVFLLYYHLVLVTKYRRQVIDDEISEFAKTTFERIAEPYHITLVEWNHEKDHVHILIDNKFIKVPKLKSLVKIKLHRQPKGMIKSATISRHSSGKYYISLLCKEEVSKLSGE